MAVAPGGAALEPPRIALVTIVRDEARCIERCLTSVRPFVDEMLVLDTGSRDATPHLAQRCGATVAHFEWVDDFSAARNAALALTRAPWRLVLDADEWLIGGAQVLAGLRDEAPAFIGMVRIGNRIDQGQTESPSWLPRVLPAGVAYSGRIHEQPQSTLPRRRLALQVAHDGYLAAQRAPKAGRNRKLLEMALAEHPGDAYWNYQLGKDLEVSAEFAPAQARYAQAYAGVAANAAWRHDLVVRWLFTLKTLGQVDAALRIAAVEAAHWDESPDFHFTLGDVLLECAIRRPQQAPQLLHRIEAAWRRALQIGERPDLPDTVHGRGSFLAAHNLAVFHASLGRADEARRWEQRALHLRSQPSQPSREPELAG